MTKCKIHKDIELRWSDILKRWVCVNCLALEYSEHTDRMMWEGSL